MDKALEKEVENEFSKKVRILGCLCYKFEIKGTKGACDRIVFLPGGLVVLIEFKRPGSLEGTSIHQKKFIKGLKDRDHIAFVTDSFHYALNVIRELLSSKD